MKRKWIVKSFALIMCVLSMSGCKDEASIESTESFEATTASITGVTAIDATGSEPTAPDTTVHETTLPETTEYATTATKATEPKPTSAAPQPINPPETTATIPSESYEKSTTSPPHETESKYENLDSMIGSAGEEEEL